MQRAGVCTSFLFHDSASGDVRQMTGLNLSHPLVTRIKPNIIIIWLNTEKQEPFIFQIKYQKSENFSALINLTGIMYTITFYQSIVNFFFVSFLRHTLFASSLYARKHLSIFEECVQPNFIATRRDKSNSFPRGFSGSAVICYENLCATVHV